MSSNPLNLAITDGCPRTYIYSLCIIRNKPKLTCLVGGPDAFLLFWQGGPGSLLQGVLWPHSPESRMSGRHMLLRSCTVERLSARRKLPLPCCLSRRELHYRQRLRTPFNRSGMA